MSINKLISIKGPILDAMEMVSVEHTKDLPVFTRWAYQAEKEIGSRYSYIKKIAVIDINGCAACLPNDAMYVQRALLGDYGCDCTDLFYRWCGTLTTASFETPQGPSFLLVDAGGDTPTMFQNVVQCEIQDNKIVLMVPRDGEKITVQYIGYKTDCDGFLEINQNHQLAIKNYICLQYYLRKKRKSNDDFFSVNYYEREWHREAGNARAQDSILTESQRDNIGNMLHDPFVGRGIKTSYASYYGGYI